MANTGKRSPTHKCYLHYFDGLTKKLELNYSDLEKTWHVWLGEIDKGQLKYLKIHVLPTTSEEM